MSRTFWIVVGAVGGVVAYRKGTRAVTRARELGPMGTAQVAAAATSKLAGRTANGLGRLQEIKARREGRLLTGRVEESKVADATLQPPPVGWVPAPAPGGPTVAVSEPGPPDPERPSHDHASNGSGGR